MHIILSKYKPRILSMVSVNTEMKCIVIEPRLIWFGWSFKFGIPSVVYLQSIKPFCN